MLRAAASVARTIAVDIIRDVNARCARWLQNWLKRHQSPVSRALHAIGIPLTIAAVLLAAYQLRHGRWDLWWRPVLVLGAGYLFQYLGHVIEGNDMGEVILVKKLLGRPYRAVSPRYGGAGCTPSERRQDAS